SPPQRSHARGRARSDDLAMRGRRMEPVSLRRALEDRRLLGGALPGRSWATWHALLIASRGEPLTEAERELVAAVIGDREPPSAPVREFETVAGRRSGKDAAAAALAVYLATLVDYSDVLRPGERGVVLLIGADTQQAKVTKGYIEGILEQSPMLREMVESITQDEIVLRNQITISVRSANYRRLRGVTAGAVIASEVAFWIDAETSANPADEILAAVRPALLTARGPLVMISSPYSRSGPLFEVWRDFYGKDDPEVLVARADAPPKPDHSAR